MVPLVHNLFVDCVLPGHLQPDHVNKGFHPMRTTALTTWLWAIMLRFDVAHAVVEPLHLWLLDIRDSPSFLALVAISLYYYIYIYTYIYVYIYILYISIIYVYIYISINTWHVSTSTMLFGWYPRSQWYLGSKHLHTGNVRGNAGSSPACWRVKRLNPHFFC